MYLSIILKTSFLYFFIMVAYRIMGKKEVGQLGVIDLIVSILMAELAAISIEKSSSSLFISIVPIAILVFLQIFLSYLSLKIPSIRNMIDGHPTVIIKNGKVRFNVMSKLRYTLDDLISQLREQGIKSIEEVNYAVLENNGKLSVFEKDKEYPLPIIVDGHIDKFVLKEINKDEKWVMELLSKKNIDLDKVFYAFYKHNGTYIITYNELI